MLKFERLTVWQKAITLTGEVHQLTRKFPKEELYILTSQIKRAADSIALNIAEGSTGQSNAEFKQFGSKYILRIDKREEIVETFEAVIDIIVGEIDRQFSDEIGLNLLKI